MQNNSNKNWENKGWEAMQQMLDNDLPTEAKEPRRRLIFWYWAAGVAVLLGVTFLNLYKSDSNLIFDKNSTPIADVSSVESKELFDKKKELETEKISPQLIENQSFTKKEKKSNLEQVSSKQKNSNQSKTPERTSLIKNETFVKNEITSSNFNKITSSKTAIQSTGVSTDFSKKADENKVLIQNEKLADLSNLPMLYADLKLAKIDLFEAPKPFSKKVKRIESSAKKMKPVFGLSAAITSDIAMNANGFQAGVFIELPIKSSKFAIQTGLNYRLTRHRELRRNWNTINSNDNDASLFADLNWGTNTDTSGIGSQPEGTSGNYYYDTDDNQIKSSQYSNYHALSVPLNLKYQLDSKWSILVGAEPSVLLNFLQKNPSTGLNDRFINAADPAFENFATFNLRNFDLAGTAAVNFQASKHWRLNLKYHHGNLFQGNNWQVDNRFLSAGGSFIF